MPKDSKLKFGPALTRREFLATAGVTTGTVMGLAACGDGSFEHDAHGPDEVAHDAMADVGEASDVPRVDGRGDADGETTGDAAPAPDIAAPSLRFDPATHSLASDNAFPLGVASGDPMPDGAVVWTLFRGAPPLELVVFEPEGPEPDVAAAGPIHLRAPAHTDARGFVHADLRGLPAGRALRFVFLTAGRRSPIGRFRTAPAIGSRPVVRFGATSCAKYELRPFSVLDRAADDDHDFFVLLGDTVYADGAVTLADFAAHWELGLAEPGWQRLLASQPVVATWDDHELANNWDPETVPQAQLEAARQALFDHLPIRRAPDAPDRLYRSLRFGATLELFVLDCRSERRPSTRRTAAAEYISEAQLEWLVAGVRQSGAIFKVIANSIPITACPPLYLGNSERWQGYAAQRARVLDALADTPGVVWLAGDFHLGAVAQVDPHGGPAHHQTEVLVGPVAHVNPALFILESTGDPRQWRFLTDARNYGRFVADPGGDTPTLTVEHVGADGQVLHSALIAPG